MCNLPQKVKSAFFWKKFLHSIHRPLKNNSKTLISAFETNFCKLHFFYFSQMLQRKQRQPTRFQATFSPHYYWRSLLVCARVCSSVLQAIFFADLINDLCKIIFHSLLSLDLDPIHSSDMIWRGPAGICSKENWTILLVRAQWARNFKIVHAKKTREIK